MNDAVDRHFIQQFRGTVHQVRNINRDHPVLCRRNRPFPERIQAILILQSRNDSFDCIHRLHWVAVQRYAVLDFQHIEFRVDRNEAIAHRLDRIDADIRRNKPTPEFMRHHRRYPTTTEKISNNHSFIGRCFDYSFKKGFRFLRGIICFFCCLRINRIDVCPQ